MDARFLPRRRDDTFVILEHIREALQPFRVQYISVEVMDTVEGRLLCVGVDVLPHHEYKEPVDDLVLTLYPVDIAIEMIGFKIGEYFRNVRVEPDDHIHLGEE